MNISRLARIALLVALSLAVMACGRKYNSPSASPEAVMPVAVRNLAAPSAS